MNAEPRQVTRTALAMNTTRPGEHRVRALAAIRSLGLDGAVANLESTGYAVIPPELAAPPDLAGKLLERLCELSEESRGCAPDMLEGVTHDDPVDPVERLDFLLARGAVFEQALMNPVVLALVDYVLGNEAVLSSCVARFKGPGPLPLMLHTDQSFHPAPLPLTCNISYALTEYRRETGGVCIVPGSHRLLRNPLPEENFHLDGHNRVEAEQVILSGGRVKVEDPPGVAVVEAPAGSIVVWSGNTWHGAFNRTVPGLRANLILFFCNPWLRPQEAYRELLHEAVLARNSERFSRLMGSGVFYGWGPEGANYNPAEAFDQARRRAGTRKAQR